MGRLICLVLTALLLCAQSPLRNFPPGTFQNRAALDGGTVANNLALDGSAVTGNASSNTKAVTFSTTLTNDIIYIYGIDNGCGGGTYGVSDTSGLTWTNRLAANHEFAFWALAASTVTSDSITFTCTGGTFVTMHVFAVHGANTGAPFDPNVSTPVSNGTGSAPSITTTNANTMLIGGFRCGANTGVQGAGFTLIAQFQFAVSEYKTLTAAATTSVPLASGCTANAAMADAITQ